MTNNFENRKGLRQKFEDFIHIQHKSLERMSGWGESIWNFLTGKRERNQGMPYIPNPVDWSENEFFRKSIEQLRSEQIIRQRQTPSIPPVIVPPEPLLPVEIDTQTAFQSPAGSSIGLRNQNFLIDKFTLGKFTYNPLKHQSKAYLRQIPSKKILDSFKKSNNICQQAYLDRMSYEYDIDPNKKQKNFLTEEQGFLFVGEDFKTFKGQGSILFGMKTISCLAQMYSEASTLAFLTPANHIVTYKQKAVSSFFKDYTCRFPIVAKEKSILMGLHLIEGKNNIENIIKYFGELQYKLTKENLEANKKKKNIDEKISSNDIPLMSNLVEVLGYFVSSLFYRNGFHRFPALLPESLSLNKYYEENKNIKDPKKLKKQPEIAIDDAMEMQEYLIKNLDEIFGQFPITLKVKKESNKEIQLIRYPNIAEYLRELMLLQLSMASNSENNLALSTKTLVTASMACNSAIVSADIAKANAKYLGYKSNEKKKQIPLQYTPGADNFKDLMKESKGNIISFENQDKDTLMDDLKTILIAAQIIKAALVHPFDKNTKALTGDDIKEYNKKRTDKYNKDWGNLITEQNKKPIGNKTQSTQTKNPVPKIKDKSIKKNN